MSGVKLGVWLLGTGGLALLEGLIPGFLTSTVEVQLWVLAALAALPLGDWVELLRGRMGLTKSREETNG